MTQIDLFDTSLTGSGAVACLLPDSDTIMLSEEKLDGEEPPQYLVELNDHWDDEENVVFSKVVSRPLGLAHQSFLVDVLTAAEDVGLPDAEARVFQAARELRDVEREDPETFPQYDGDGGGGDGDGSEEDETNLATKIADYVTTRAELFTDDRGDAYAAVKVEGHRETLKIKSTRFKRWLQKTGRLVNNQKIPYNDALLGARRELQATAFFEGGEKELHNRVAEVEGNLWIDMTDAEWRAIKVSQKGWEVVQDPPIMFRRETHQAPQVEPVKGGDPWRLFEFVNVPEDRRLLVLVYVATCLVPDIPHPVPVFHGPAGSGKSLSMEFIRQIIDPSKAPRLKTPRADKDLVQNFDHHYAPYYDNLRTLPSWLSDVFCRVVTGDGSEYRALYTDDEAVVRAYKRCLGLNGVNVAATAPDLLDRCLLVELDIIPPEMRENEQDLRASFEAARPEILGGILDALSEALTIFPAVELEELPRMADFAKWGYAVAEALGERGDEFLDAYLEDGQDRTREALEAHPVGLAVERFMETRDSWSGAPKDLLEELEEVAEEEGINTDAKLWPGSASWVYRRLKDVKPQLKQVGIEVNRTKSKHRFIVLSKGSENGVGAVNAVESEDENRDGISTALTAKENAVGNSEDAVETSGRGSTDSTDSTDGKIPTLTENGENGGDRTETTGFDRLHEAADALDKQHLKDAVGRPECPVCGTTYSHDEGAFVLAQHCQQEHDAPKDAEELEKWAVAQGGEP